MKLRLEVFEFSEDWIKELCISLEDSLIWEVHRDFLALSHQVDSSQADHMRLAESCWDVKDDLSLSQQHSSLNLPVIRFFSRVFKVFINEVSKSLTFFLEAWVIYEIGRKYKLLIAILFSPLSFSIVFLFFSWLKKVLSELEISSWSVHRCPEFLNSDGI